MVFVILDLEFYCVLSYMLLSWNITKRCNLNCSHCYRSSSSSADTSEELSLREGRKLIDQIAAAGFRLLILSGGEPLLRADVFELISYASSAGLRPVLGTNGTLIDPETARRLKESGLAGAGVSLDDTQPDYHDRFRGIEGAHRKAVNGINNLLDAGLKTQINMTVTEINRHRIEPMIRLAVRLGVDALHPFFFVPAGRGKNMENATIGRRQYFELLEMILEQQKSLALELKPTCAPQFMPIAQELGLKTRFTRGCLAGVSYCCVLPGGDVHACPYLPVSAGSVRERPFNEIWEESKVFERLRNYGLYEGRCGRCEHVDICGGCRARAFVDSGGSYLAQDPWCR